MVDVIEAIRRICSRHQSYPDVIDDDEGGGEDDMNAYDITPLRIPIDPTGQTIPGKPTMIRDMRHHRQCKRCFFFIHDIYVIKRFFFCISSI